LVKVKEMKTHEPVAFRPNAEVARLISLMDSVHGLNRSEIFNRAMLRGLPEVLAEVARDARRLVSQHQNS